jgi:L-threonylcarbamoyladenylate synthase
LSETTTRVLFLDGSEHDEVWINEASRILLDEGLVAFPTETVYGLGALGLDETAVKKIYIAKGRQSNNPLILHVSSLTMAKSLVLDWPEIGDLLAEKFWPGPLTLVLKKAVHVPNIVTGGGDTVAIRMPSHPIAHALIQAVGAPLAAPSANRSLELSPTKAEHVMKHLNGRIDLILDGGPTEAGLESTVIDLTTTLPTLLRPGPIPRSKIESVIGPIQLIDRVDPTQPLPAPGLLDKHYSPKTTLRWWVPGQVIGKNERLLTLDPDPITAAATLFTQLHELDELNLARIWIAPFPKTEAWAAIRDRLDRASKNG